MKGTMLHRCAGVLVLILTACQAFAQGAYSESQISGGFAGNQPTTQKMYYMPKMAKVVDENNQHVAIIRLDREMLYSIEPAKKEYSEMTFAELEKEMQKASAKMADMQKQMQGMPPEQRAMVEKMLGNATDKTPVTVTPGSETRTISGFSCKKYTLQRGEKTVVTVWATKDITGYEAIRKDWDQVQKRLMAMVPGGARGIAEAMANVPGFAIETSMEGGMKNVVTKFEKRSVPTSEFEVPAGYKKVKNPSLQTDTEP
jgi:hypothetical protein